MNLLDDIPIEELREVGTIPWYGLEYSLDDLIVYMFYGHKREHSAEIAVFRTNRSVRVVITRYNFIFLLRLLWGHAPILSDKSFMSLTATITRFQATIVPRFVLRKGPRQQYLLLSGLLEHLTPCQNGLQKG